MKATLALALFGTALISAPVTAQTTRPADPAPMATQRTAEAKAPALYEMKAGQWRASKLDGLDVYNPNNEKIGDISELVIDRSGRIQAVVIGVGGFLGIGEHLVAVPFEQVQWIDQPRAVSSTAPGGAPMTGSSAPAPAAGTDRADRPAMTTAPMDRAAGTTAATGGATGTTTTVDRQTGTTVTTTTDRPAGTMATDRPAGTMATDRPAAGAAGDRAAGDRGAPDHAIVAMTKEQLRALPEVRYSR
ncbi:MAG: PRC-barrel domain-containing protein [Alphaproteobacteria bacterium]